MYKDRKETTNGEIGEKQHTSTYIKMKMNTMYVIRKMVTRLMYKRIM